MPFDPWNLRGDASMNRVVIASPPPGPFADAVRGKRSFDLLSLEALVPKIAACASDLKLSATELSDPSHLPEVLSRCLESKDATVRATAEALAEERGACIAYHVATLHRGDDASRAARPDWDGSHWAWWASIRHVILGGGTMNGALGRRVIEAAQAYSERWDIDVALRVADEPLLLGLQGAARSVPMPALSALVLDFGNTGAKAAFVHYEAGVLTSLQRLPTQPVVDYMMPVQTLEGTRALGDFVTDLIAQHWQSGRDARLSLAPTIVCSMSGYLADNHPLDVNSSSYSSLGMLAPNLGTWLSQHVSFEVGEAVLVELVHDCTCAARAFPGAEATAVLMLGTSLGVGFPPRG